MNWLQRNWDKLLSAVLSAAVGGVVGFFSAILALEKEISEIKTDVNTLKVRVEEAISPKLKDIDSVSTKLNTLEGRIIVIETQSLFIKNQSEILLKAQVERPQK